MTTQHRQRLHSWASVEGAPAPLGASWVEEEQAFNFALYSRHATAVTLLCYTDADPVTPVFHYRFDHLINKTGRVWHCRVPVAALDASTLYAYKVEGPNDPGNGHCFDAAKVLLDPYAQRVFFPPAFSRIACCDAGPTDGKAPLGFLPERAPLRPWIVNGRPHHSHDAVIYELHVKGFTARANSGVTAGKRGTFAGLVEKIPYLQELGVTIVELLPVHQFDPQEGNYWGYMTLNFFSPHAAYASSDPLDEFRDMVAAFHAAGIEVWLDVVYNHTSEGNQLGPTYSWRGIDNSTYYVLGPDSLTEYVNESGAGNTTRCNHPATRELIFDSLRYWANEMLVDGFRFDLASIFSLSDDGRSELADPPLIAEIGALASILDLSLVAEAWDVNSYQLGRSFPGFTWDQWNGKFRDEVRSFVKGDQGVLPALIRRLYGSDDLFPDTLAEAYRPFQSVNFVTAHDGLCLYDLVSYTRDQHSSWDCGWQGDHGVPPEVMDLRRRQIKNFCCLLMLANGVPMLVAGDEFMNTQHGHDNPYDQDNETTWLDWDKLQTNADLFRFFKLMIAFRKAHPSIARSKFWRDDVTWYGVEGAVDYSPHSRALAYHLRGASQEDDDLYVMINSYWQKLIFKVQATAPTQWLRVVDTARPSPQDVLERGQEELMTDQHYEVGPRSVVVLRGPRASA
ncbi:MAG TPA: isoamylase [Dehalococcoidia bacterium]|nr:isoamylase [Dehalococcoidia bacterium]